MTFDPLCPDLISRVSVSGISYLGNKFNFTFSKDTVTLEVTVRAEPWAPLLEVELWPSLTRLPLPPGKEKPLGLWCRSLGACPKGLTISFAGHKVCFPHSAGRIQKSSP